MDYLEIEPESSTTHTLYPHHPRRHPLQHQLTTVPSSNSVASRLYQNGTATSQRNSRRNSFSSEPELLMSFHECASQGSQEDRLSGDGLSGIGFSDVTSQMSMMSKKLTDLQELHMATTEERSRLKAENSVLQERVGLLEEQFQAREQRWQEKLEEEKQRAKEQGQRWEREKQLVEESGSLRHQVAQRDLTQVTRERDRMEKELREAQTRAHQLADQLHEAQIETERLEKERNTIKGEFERFRRETATRMDTSSEMLEELARQTTEMRHQNSMGHSLAHHRQGSLTDQIILLEDEIERLRLENRELREHSEDLQAQLLHDSVECGRNLLADQAPSLAAELGGMDTQGLMNTLKEQEIVNQRLRNYVNGILTRILERHPDILEIKATEMDSTTALKSGSTPNYLINGGGEDCGSSGVASGGGSDVGVGTATSASSPSASSSQ